LKTLPFYRSYCAQVLNKNYHAPQYGFQLNSDDNLFERLLLETAQARFLWITILKKAENFHHEYSGLNKIEKIPNEIEKDHACLLVHAGIIRNQLKVNAAIVNAQKEP
jgi:DNA-3-methyladenine glycosylase I